MLHDFGPKILARNDPEPSKNQNSLTISWLISWNQPVSCQIYMVFKTSYNTHVKVYLNSRNIKKLYLRVSAWMEVNILILLQNMNQLYGSIVRYRSPNFCCRRKVNGWKVGESCLRILSCELFLRNWPQGTNSSFVQSRREAKKVYLR